MNTTRAPTAWEAFVLRHRDPLNLRIHFASMWLYLVGCTAFFAVLTTEGRFSFGWFAVWCSSGPLGAFGHWWTGDGRVSTKEATHDPLVPLFVFRMFWHLGRGTYGEEVARAGGRLGIGNEGNEPQRHREHRGETQRS